MYFLCVVYVHQVLLSIENLKKFQSCTTVIGWLTHFPGDFQCKENFNESAIRLII